MGTRQGAADLSPLTTTTAEVLEVLRGLDIVVTDFRDESQDAFDKRLRDFVENLHELDQLSGRYGNVQVPLDVLSYVDDGINPDLYTRDCLEETKARNETVKGKVDAIARLRDFLEAEMDKHFPDDVERYRALRASALQQGDAGSRSASANGSSAAPPDK